MHLTDEQIQKYYRYAYSIAGALYRDLFHHVYCELPGNIQNPDSYIYRSMLNAYINKKSTFNKMYTIQENEIDVQVADEIQQHSKYDSFLLHKILLEMEMEGFEHEVRIYKEVRLVSNIVRLSKKIGVTPKTLSKIVNFVENEVRSRYLQYNS